MCNLVVGNRYFANVVVNSAGLKVRPTPGTSGDPIGYWPNGRLAVIEPIQGDNDWVKCKWKNSYGYVQKSYLDDFQLIENLTYTQFLTNVGTNEEQVSYQNKFYGPDLTEADWCQYFASWMVPHCFWYSMNVPTASSCRDGVIHFLDAGIFLFVNAWHKNDVYTNTTQTSQSMSSGSLTALEQVFTGQEGNFVYFRRCSDHADYSSSETAYHVGVVTAVESVSTGIRITAVEGNQTDGNNTDCVRFKTYDPTPSTNPDPNGLFHRDILGFGYPLGIG